MYLQMAKTSLHIYVEPHLYGGDFTSIFLILYTHSVRFISKFFMLYVNSHEGNLTELKHIIRRRWKYFLCTLNFKPKSTLTSCVCVCVQYQHPHCQDSKLTIGESYGEVQVIPPQPSITCTIQHLPTSR